MNHNRAASYTRVFPGDALTAGHQAEAIRRLADTLGMDHRPGIRGRGVRLRPRRPTPVPADDGRGQVGKQTLRRRHCVRPLAVRRRRGRPDEVREGAPGRRSRAALRAGQAAPSSATTARDPVLRRRRAA